MKLTVAKEAGSVKYGGRTVKFNLTQIRKCFLQYSNIYQEYNNKKNILQTLYFVWELLYTILRKNHFKCKTILIFSIQHHILPVYQYSNLQQL